MFNSASLCPDLQLTRILIREFEDEVEPPLFVFGLLGLLTEVIAGAWPGFGAGTRGRGIGYSIILYYMSDFRRK